MGLIFFGFLGLITLFITDWTDLTRFSQIFLILSIENQKNL
jgi:hypothetical protein